MWYFAWILGTGFACSLAILWGMWHELRFPHKQEKGESCSSP